MLLLSPLLRPILELIMAAVLTPRGAPPNLLLKSEQMDNAAWTKTATTVIAMPATSLGFDVFATTGNGVTSYLGDSASGIYVWGGQVTLGAPLYPYQATV